MEEFVMTSLPAELHGYHVHIYYDDATLPVATKLRDSLAANFAVQLGRNSGIAGPHPVPQMQVIFKTDVFQHIVPWLMFNREGLDILVHPLTDDEYEDHTSQALWLGTPVQLKLDTLPHGPYPAALLPAA
jgi:aromatic ring-cleaving dioxygenase